MNQLLESANDLLKQGGFQYAICGGFALELFANKAMRRHGDMDICVFEKDKNAIVTFMQENGWKIYEFCGQGIVRSINSSSECQQGRNLMCVKGDCDIVKFYPCDRGESYFLHEFFDTGISSFNYLELLFNQAESGDFIFHGNRNIRREMSKAILKREHIPFLAPELVLLYKAENVEHQWNQYDYEQTMIALSDEQAGWLNDSLFVLYPKGHNWRS